MQTTELPAGPELDALIAERVFGLTVVKAQPFAFTYAAATGRATIRRDAIPAYSTEWGAAGHIMEHFAATYRYLWLSYEAVDYMGLSNRGMHWKCTFAAPQQFNATGETAPLAICRAALRYVELMRP